MICKGFAASLAAVLALMACKAPKPVPRLEITVGGCARVTAEEGVPRCRLSPGDRLTVWARSDPGAELSVTMGDRRGGGDRPSLVNFSEIEGGRRWALDAPSRLPAVLWVHASAGRGSASEPIPLEENPWVRIDALATAELPHAAQRTLLEERLTTAAAGPEQTLLQAQLGHLAYVIESYDNAESHLETAASGFEKWGMSSDLVDAITLCFQISFFGRGDLTDANRLLDSLDEPAPWDGTSSFLISFYRGVWALSTGDVRDALGQLRAAVRFAERMGEPTWRHMAEQLLLQQLRQWGRHEEAAALRTRLERSAAVLEDPCERADFHMNLAWDELLAAEKEWLQTPLGQPVAGRGDLGPDLEAAAMELDRCHGEHERRNAELNLAFDRLHQADAAGAARHLAQARAAGPSSWRFEHRLWERELAARTELVAGRPATATEIYREVLRRTGPATPDARWRSTVGLARALDTAGRAEAALMAYAEAEILLDRSALAVPIDAGREVSFFAGEAATGLHLDLLLRQGLLERALEVARTARTRMLRTLALGARLAALGPSEQAEWAALLDHHRLLSTRLDEELGKLWRLPADKVETATHASKSLEADLRQVLDRAFLLLGSPTAPPPVVQRPDEAWLIYHPLPEGWLGMIVRRGEVTARRLADPTPFLEDPRALTAVVLEPFAPDLREAAKLKLLLYGELRQVDFAALPWGDDILAAAKTLIYGLDLPVPEDDRPGMENGPSSSAEALLVADPSSTLLLAGEEIEAVAVALEVRRVRRLVGSEATAEAMRDGLARAAHLHFAGHARIEETSPWGGGLELARGRLRPGDVLTAGRVPRTVVLSACQAGVGRRVGIEPLGLAQAFVIAGTGEAVAPVRKVDDTTAKALAEALYRAWQGVSLAEALRYAQLELRQNPRSDWAAFRAFGR